MKKRVAVYLPNVHGGGAQRVLITLANEFADRGYPTDLLVARYSGHFQDEICSRVRVMDLAASRTVTSIPGLIKYLKRKRPAALLSTLMYANVVACCAHFIAGSNARLVVREANSISRPEARRLSVKDQLVRVAAGIAYQRSDYVVGISRGVTDELIDRLKVVSGKAVTIYNPVDSGRLYAMSQISKSARRDGPPLILGAGRLTRQKGFSTLIRAFARVRRRRDARLCILGEGKRRLELESLASELGIEKDVRMPGFVVNPFEYMSASSVFVLSSLWEGFGNVVLEAMACGVPVISTDCRSGPGEILEGGKWGKLVPVDDELAMGEAINSVLDTPHVDPEAARLRTYDFTPEKIANQYLGLMVNGE